LPIDKKNDEAAWFLSREETFRSAVAKISSLALQDPALGEGFNCCKVETPIHDSIRDLVT
jgi:hypothetical protein